MIHSTYRNRLGCAPGGSCCSECAGHGMGDAPDSSDFTDFLAANPDLQAQQLAYQQTNPGDPALQPLVFNPVTNTVSLAPAALPTTASMVVPASSSFSDWITSNTGSVAILAVITGGLLLLNSIGPGQTRKRR
jgi:hypothetical protein